LEPRDFIIKSELYGIPQRRHRVILLGVKKGFLPDGADVGTLTATSTVTVNDALRGMPALRSTISPPTADSPAEWRKVRADVANRPIDAGSTFSRGDKSMPREDLPTNDAYAGWIIDNRLQDVVQHQTRGHMVNDLKRYWFAASQAKDTHVSPRLSSFPPELQPNHKNAAAASHPFEDRFRVQVGSGTATTIVSHISKDGHYYIHPDPEQMRSLTVREAARLQSFPDNYFFMGNRTQQYHQVGNAVPPLLANQIASVVASIFTQNASAGDPTSSK
jgi:DNA (cytosine-5)-methyltransferase 1